MQLWHIIVTVWRMMTWFASSESGLAMGKKIRLISLILNSHHLTTWSWWKVSVGITSWVQRGRLITEQTISDDNIWRETAPTEPISWTTRVTHVESRIRLWERAKMMKWNPFRLWQIIRVRPWQCEHIMPNLRAFVQRAVQWPQTSAQLFI